MPITTKVVCFSRLLKCLRILHGKQCGPRSDCSYRSSLFWVHAICFYTSFVSNVRQLFAADDFSRRHFQMLFFLGALRVNTKFLLYVLIKVLPILYNDCQLYDVSHRSMSNTYKIRQFYLNTNFSNILTEDIPIQ